jgi:hypothetical protein
MRLLTSVAPFSLFALACSGSPATSERARTVESPLGAYGGAGTSGEEIIYAFLDEGTLAVANELLADRWDMGPREPVEAIAPITWTEFYGDSYWRFLFYSLRPTANLLWAWQTTGDATYRDKLVAILQSYATYDLARTTLDRTRFDNRHTAAFRAMVLVNSYAKLRAAGALSATLDAQLLQCIAKLGAFLADPENFEGDFNHGFTEAAALALVSLNHPSLPGGPQWEATAVRRLNAVMDAAVDADGVEVENSPFYHFYVLTFATQIDTWAQAWGLPLGADFGGKTQGMIRYATYMPQPDGNIPLLGASVALSARKDEPDVYDPMAQTHPDFAYMRTGGVSGAPPSERNVLFPVSGQSILRSSWGTSQNFATQTQLTFDVGPYRTVHSHLDALTVTYYSAGRELLTDSGLMTYDAGADFDYFHGTRAHNTVVVDGRDQAEGAANAGLTATGLLWAYQSGSEALNAGVEHARSVVLLQQDLALVIDDLASAEVHDYAQTWHVVPGATVAASGLDATASVGGKAVLAVHQAIETGLSLATVRGQAAPMQGWYSSTYGTKVANVALEYHAESATQSFVTLIASGKYAPLPARLAASVEDGAVHVAICIDTVKLAVDLVNQVSPGEAVNVTQTAECP